MLERLCSPQFWLFVLVGTVNTVLGYAIFGIGYQWLGWNYNLALAVAYALGILLGYFNHRRVTFRSSTAHRRALTRFVMTYVLVFLLNAALLTLLTETLGISPLLGQIVALVVVTLISFILQRRWVFGHD